MFENMAIGEIRIVTNSGATYSLNNGIIHRLHNSLPIWGDSKDTVGDWLKIGKLTDFLSIPAVGMPLKLAFEEEGGTRKRGVRSTPIKEIGIMTDIGLVKTSFLDVPVNEEIGFLF